MAQTSGTFPGLSDGSKKTIMQPLAPTFASPKRAAVPPAPKMPAAKAAVKAPSHHGSNLGKYLHPPKGKR